MPYEEQEAWGSNSLEICDWDVKGVSDRSGCVCVGGGGGGLSPHENNGEGVDGVSCKSVNTFYFYGGGGGGIYPFDSRYPLQKYYSFFWGLKQWICFSLDSKKYSNDPYRLSFCEM